MRFGEFDGEWEEKRLEEAAPLQRGFDLPIDKIKKGKYPVVFSNGILKFHNEFKVMGPGVVTGRSGTIGKVTFVEDDYWPHNTALWVTDFKNNMPKQGSKQDRDTTHIYTVIFGPMFPENLM